MACPKKNFIEAGTGGGAAAPEKKLKIPPSRLRKISAGDLPHFSLLFPYPFLLFL